MTKPTKWHVRPAKTQISLGIAAQADLSLHWAQSFCWFCHDVAHFMDFHDWHLTLHVKHSLFGCRVLFMIR